MRALWLVGWVLAGVLAPAAQIEEYRCAGCGRLGGEKEQPYVVKDSVMQREVLLCPECKEFEPFCFLCSLPIRQGGAMDLSDGRFLCPRDAQVAVVKLEEFERIAEETRVAVDRTLSRFLTFPNRVQVSLEDARRMTQAVSAGGSRQCAYPLCRTVSRRSPAGGGWEHSIGALHGQPRAWLALGFAHSLAHAWLTENKPEARKLAGPTAEAFCDLVAWNAAEELGLAGERRRLESSRFSEGQLPLLLEAQRAYELNAVVEWVRFGEDPRLIPGDADRVRRLDEALMPSKRSEQQVIPPSPGAASAPARLALNGILGSGQRRLALINDTTLQVGEKGRVRLGDGVIEVQCVEIREDTAVVLVVATGERVELRLKAAK